MLLEEAEADALEFAVDSVGEGGYLCLCEKVAKVETFFDFFVLSGEAFFLALQFGNATALVFCHRQLHLFVLLLADGVLCGANFGFYGADCFGRAFSFVSDFLLNFGNLGGQGEVLSGCLVNRRRRALGFQVCDLRFGVCLLLLGFLQGGGQGCDFGFQLGDRRLACLGFSALVDVLQFFALAEVEFLAHLLDLICREALVAGRAYRLAFVPRFLADAVVVREQLCAEVAQVLELRFSSSDVFLDVLDCASGFRCLPLGEKDVGVNICRQVVLALGVGGSAFCDFSLQLCDLLLKFRCGGTAGGCVCLLDRQVVELL